ncbi:tetratricopeptide repeat protein [Tamlana sp. 2_MG-2023]|uniref:tetratricopeptide repeat protein n=1 Tax=unclassified Tamlana TaxID=2614803 RepID=UPI0026E205DF|nr:MULTISPECIES: tetratricopeptide repeat protein [unclassified Tamlana]MDO6761851.1 tetratricopeptide repeat protein [Tamlana sp. 2_MG-2023]MDO6792622.1 tetratricopeptide repeat protein [Tamlana sp. 1_MG-2023]
MNLTKKLFLFSIISVFTISCKKRNESEKIESTITVSELKIKQQKQDSIINKHLKKGAWKYPLYSTEWQSEIDKGLEKDSTIAYLWQQKAMPLFKQGKYEIGMEYIDKAVQYDRQRWQDYRAFIKCIFAKTYREAIKDFEDYKKRYGYSYVMDHTYDFHIALSYLQLNEFKKAEQIFKIDYEKQLSEHGKDWLHPVDLFYYGISKYEQGKYQEAIELFDLALELYSQFSDVQYYKAICLSKIGKVDEAQKLIKLAKINGEKGFTINEDNVIYERYPYQVRWN